MGKYVPLPGLFTTEFSFAPCIRGSSLKANRLSSKVSSLGWEPKAAQPLGRDTPDLNCLKDSGREGELASMGLSPPIYTQASSQVLFLLWKPQLSLMMEAQRDGNHDQMGQWARGSESG